VIGRSGCGKSTLLRIVAGLATPTAGTIRLGAGDDAERRKDLRIMFQDARLLPWRKVLENAMIGLQMPLPAARAAAHAALVAVGLDDRAGDWPSTLSGGQRQRVALARALAHRPRLLLLDEPFGALDALTRIEMQSLVEGLWAHQRFTALLVTHDVAEAVALADRILVIEEGRVALDLPVTLPRPRDRGTLAFAELQDRVLRRVLGAPTLHPPGG
jgi:sulfonate transport system ATP-binding protein